MLGHFFTDILKQLSKIALKSICTLPTKISDGRVCAPLLILLLCIVFKAGAQVQVANAVKTKWVQQLSAVQDTSRSKLMNGLKLEFYQYLGVLTSKDSIKTVNKRLQANDELFPVIVDVNKFEYETIGTIKKNPVRGSWKFEPERFKNFLETQIKPGMELVILKWSYKGKFYDSICIVSDKHGGIFYNNILTNAVVVAINK